ncbi:MAG: response regulator [Pseudomonadales bacterium]
MNGAEHRIRVLLVDDDAEIRSLVREYLDGYGLEVLTAGDGARMRRLLETGSPDIVLLDIMLPGEDGLTLCREIRAQRNLPIILLTALAGESDRVVGLEMGADDYLVKPFSTRELLARIRAVLRRSSDRIAVHRPDSVDRYTFSGWRLAPGRRQLFDPEGVLVSLSGGEFDLLLALVRHPQTILSRERLLELTKGRPADAFDRSIDVQISRLRRKLRDPELIKTVRGGGYVLATQVQGD